MNKTELLLASKLLVLAANEFGNHGCNDYELENTPENRNLMNDVYKWNCKDGEVYDINFNRDETEIYAMDYYLMAYCAYLLKQDADKVA